jgi:hypothetical protein
MRVSRAPGLTSVREASAVAGLGDMMIDGVVPLVVGRASLSEVVRTRSRGAGTGKQGQFGAPAQGGHGASVVVQAAAFIRIPGYRPVAGMGA